MNGIIISPGRQVTVGPTSAVRIGDIFVSFEDAPILVSAILLAVPSQDPVVEAMKRATACRTHPACSAAAACPRPARTTKCAGTTYRPGRAHRPAASEHQR